MIKNNFNAQGYKAPVCKVVRVHVEGLICSSPDLLMGNTLDDAEEENLGTL